MFFNVVVVICLFVDLDFDYNEILGFVVVVVVVIVFLSNYPSSYPKFVKKFVLMLMFSIGFYWLVVVMMLKLDWFFIKFDVL